MVNILFEQKLHRSNTTTNKLITVALLTTYPDATQPCSDTSPWLSYEFTVGFRAFCSVGKSLSRVSNVIYSSTYLEKCETNRESEKFHFAAGFRMS